MENIILLYGMHRLMPLPGRFELHLPVPDANFETVVAKPSEIQKEMVQELSKRAAKIHSGAVEIGRASCRERV